MKNALKDFLLWQKKRNELPVNDDPQVDWGQMQSLLDEHLPVVKKPGGFKGFRTLPAIFITFSAAAMIYVAGNIYSLEKHDHAVKHHFHKGNPMRSGSHFADSLDTAAGTENKKAGTENLLPGSKDAADQSDSYAAASNSIKLSAKSGQAGNAKNSETARYTRAGHIPGGAGGQSNQLLAARQNANLVKSAVSNNKTVLGKGLSPYYHGSNIISGRGGGNHNKAAGGKKSGGNPVNSNTGPTATAINIFNNPAQGEREPLTSALLPALKFDLSLNKIQPAALPVLNSRLNQAIFQAGNQTKGSKKIKPDKPQNNQLSNIDWGILVGVNTSGSFTSKSQNANFYGSGPIDPWFGLFASYKINSNWTVATQVHFFSPETIVTNYTHANQSKIDSGQTLSITASRKMYAVSVPVYAVYNTGSGLSFKAGPVINFPVKQINTSSILLPHANRTDTTYYKNIGPILNAAQYRQNINFGVSAGASYQFRRFIFEATYLKSISGYGINSGLGAYKSYNGTFQISIGFQLDKVKP